MMEIMSSVPYRFTWSGDSNPYLDTPTIEKCGPVSIGMYGGCSAAGAHKNEDAALVWTAADSSWVFAALLDAHGSSESANLVLRHIANLESQIADFLDANNAPLWELSTRIANHFSNTEFRAACAAVCGETALFLCAQKGGYVWWLSVGDVSAYVFHSEFARLGQFALNQRMFFEWIGHVNSFALPTPCYTTGVRQLRPGKSQLLIATDGLLECGSRTFENPQSLYMLFGFDKDAASKALRQVHAECGRDSATLVYWEADILDSPEILCPSA